MKKRHLLAVIVLVLSLMLTCSACGSSDNSSSATVQNNGNYKTNSNFVAEDSMESVNLSGDVSTDAGGSSTVQVASNRKLIKTIDLTAETKEFDSFIEGLEKAITECGGYVESSNVNGNSYDSFINRSADFTVRIPADKLESFSATVSEICNITSRNESVLDVTMDYVDYESRLAAYETEHEALLELLAEADSVETIISIQSRITDVVYQIESCKSQLRTYDNLVDYSTVNLDIYEVDRETTVPEEEEGVWQRIKNDISDNLYDIGNWFEEAFVYLMGNLPYLVIWAILIISVVVFIKIMVRRRRKRRLAKKAAKLEAEKNDLNK